MTLPSSVCRLPLHCCRRRRRCKKDPVTRLWTEMKRKWRRKAKKVPGTLRLFSTGVSSIRTLSRYSTWIAVSCTSEACSKSHRVPSHCGRKTGTSVPLKEDFLQPSRKQHEPRKHVELCLWIVVGMRLISLCPVQNWILTFGCGKFDCVAVLFYLENVKI